MFYCLHFLNEWSARAVLDYRRFNRAFWFRLFYWFMNTVLLNWRGRTLNHTLGFFHRWRRFLRWKIRTFKLRNAFLRWFLRTFVVKLANFVSFFRWWCEWNNRLAFSCYSWLDNTGLLESLIDTSVRFVWRSFFSLIDSNRSFKHHIHQIVNGCCTSWPCWLFDHICHNRTIL